MAVQRRNNVLSQERIDVPTFRSIESAVSADFDTFIESFVTGAGNPYVVNGFELNLTSSWVGTPASSLQVVVAGGALFQTVASQSGTFYLVPEGTPNVTLNAATVSNVYGAFVPSAFNYVGIDYYRFQDPTTDTQVYLWNPTAEDEDQAIAPAAIVMNYEFVITSSLWASNILPIAIVQTDASNNVLSVTDARPLLFRLGTGGATPNPYYVYPWPEGQTENSPTSSSNSSNPFYGGDKGITDLKDWMNAVMTQLLGLSGNIFWYSPVNGTGGGGSIVDLREDTANTILTGNGNITHSATTAGLVNWSSTLNLTIVGSNLAYQISTNPTGTSVTLSDNEVAYLQLSRDVSIATNLVWTNGSPTVSSVGNVAWTTGLYSTNVNGYGDWIKLTSSSHAGYYQIQSVDNTYTVTLTSNFAGTSTGAGGAPSQYAYGLYTLPGITSTSRDIQLAQRENVPINPSTFWLFSRNDNGGAIPRVFVRWLGLDLQQGDSEEISGPQLQNVLDYIGSPIESATEPQYVLAYNIYLGDGPSVLPQISTVTTTAASGMVASEYFVAYSSIDSRIYTVWFKINGSGTQPVVAGTNDNIEVDILSSDTADQVATKLAAAMNNYLPFNDFSANAVSNLVTITNNSAGVCSGVANGNTPFSFATVQVGTGEGNYVINDGDDLTLAIKKLDKAIGDLESSLDSPTYDEVVEIVASGATPPTSLNGPIANSAIITLPLNSREGNVLTQYTVGKGTLQIFLNGQFIDVESGAYAEVGTLDTPSNQIQILTLPGGGLVVGDELEFRMGGGGGGGGGGGEGPPGPQGPTGPAGPAGADALNGPINISTKISSYTVLNTDGFLLADCTSGNIVFTLPTAASSASKVKYFKKIDSSGNSMTIMGAGADLIDGSNTVSTIIQYEAFSMVSDGAQWYLF